MGFLVHVVLGICLFPLGLCFHQHLISKLHQHASRLLSFRILVIWIFTWLLFTFSEFSILLFPLSCYYLLPSLSCDQSTPALASQGDYQETREREREIFQAALTATHSTLSTFRLHHLSFRMVCFCSLPYQLSIIFSSWLPYMFPHMCTAQISFSHCSFHSTGLRVSTQAWDLDPFDFTENGLWPNWLRPVPENVLHTLEKNVYSPVVECSLHVNSVPHIFPWSSVWWFYHYWKGGTKISNLIWTIKTITWIIELIFKKKFHEKLLFRSKCTPANEDQRIFTTFITNVGSSETHILPPAP